MVYLLFFFLIINASAEANVLDIDLLSFCEEEGLKSYTPPPCQVPLKSEGPLEGLAFSMNQLGLSPHSTLDKAATCKMIQEISAQDVSPVEILKKTESGEEWKFRFHFGYNRTIYAPTNMKLSSSRLNVVIKDFEFQERTSADFYNPKNWESAQDAFRWIDEPTNMFSLSAEKKNNVFYINAFHPKFLKERYQDKLVTGTVDGVAVNQVMPINEEFDGYNAKPGEMNLVRFENTHKQMDWQIGYGRKFVIFDNKKAGQLSYTPQAFVGLTTGKHLTVYTKEGEYWEFDDFEDKSRIQGVNAALGHELEYKRGKFGVFAAQKVTVSHLKQGFMDGTAEFNMMYVNPITVGITIDLYKTKKKTNP
ncbi:MAG: hypothetical protein K2P81_01970 [Bacteriovoracaceae bacterium]|nr:hypothetical protein [Bacteriovoracaceae bacterium]